MARITLLPVRDAYIAEWYPADSFAFSHLLYAGQYHGKGDIYRSILYFPIDMVPGNVTVLKAELEMLLCRNEMQDENGGIDFHHVLGSWGNSPVSWERQPLYDSIPDNRMELGRDTPAGWVKVDLTELVQKWYDGSVINNGILLKGDESLNSLVGWYSSKNADSSTWPRLHIYYRHGCWQAYLQQDLLVPVPPEVPLVASDSLPLGPGTQATFLVANASDSTQVKVLLQVGFSPFEEATFFDVGTWVDLQPQGYPGEAIALSVEEIAEYARVLIQGEGGERVRVYPRTLEY